jgi:hypothetical protein
MSFNALNAGLFGSLSAAGLGRQVTEIRKPNRYSPVEGSFCIPHRISESCRPCRTTSRGGGVSGVGIGRAYHRSVLARFDQTSPGIGRADGMAGLNDHPSPRDCELDRPG